MDFRVLFMFITNKSKLLHVSEGFDFIFTELYLLKMYGGLSCFSECYLRLRLYRNGKSECFITHSNNCRMLDTGREAI